MQLYFVRHGESTANLTNEFSNRDIKHPLTEKGKQQALILAETLKSIPFTQIYSSPLLRAQQTSTILAYILQLPVTLTDALREFDVGIYEGKTNQQSWQAYTKVIHAWLYQQDYHQSLPGGESFQDLINRFLPFLNTLQQQYSNPNMALLFVGHGGLYRCIIPYIFTNLTYDFTEQYLIKNTDVIWGSYHHSQWICHQWCGISLD